MVEPFSFPPSEGYLPNSSVTALQAALDEEVRKLHVPRLGKIILELCVCNEYDTPTSYESANVCHLMESLKHSNAYLYLHPKYSSLQHSDDSSKGEGEVTRSDETEINMQQNVSDSIKRAAVTGGDRLCLGSQRKRTAQENKSNKSIRCFHLLCQCSRVYHGKKVDGTTGSIIDRQDYRNSSITNDKKNRRHGKKGRASSHRTDTVFRLSRNENRCSFSISVFHNNFGYYIKPKPGNGNHEYHDVRPDLRMPSNLLQGEDAAIMKDLNSAKALTGVAVNAHYVRSSRKGTPTLLSRDQVRYICHGKKDLNQKTEETNTLEGSDMDDLFHFFEQNGSSYVALIQEMKKDNTKSSAKKEGFLFNETRIHDFVTKAAYEIVTPEDATAKKSANNFRHSRKIRDDQEMVVGVAYVTPFECRQFKLFHCVLQIDATADTNNEGRPLVTGTAKDSEGKMFTVFALSNHPRSRMFLVQSWLIRY